MYWTEVRITIDTVKPLQEYTEAMETYPIPSNITVWWGWGRLNRSPPFKQHLAPFLALLNKRIRFFWEKNLQKLCDVAKVIIARRITEGRKTEGPPYRLKQDQDWIYVDAETLRLHRNNLQMP